jgi:hypothetical protein
MREKHVYQVGDKVLHTEFGEGLVVDIRDRTFYDVLEVVFAGGVKRLTSVHPLLQLKPDLPEPPAPRPRRSRRKPPAENNGGVIERLPYLTLDMDSLSLLDESSNGAGDGLEDYRLHLEAETMAARRGFDRLICLGHLSGVEQLEYQKKACLRVLREMRGRGLLADEVGLGKTIEAGMVLKEYVLRGLVQRFLVLVPAGLTNQWREELATKFDLNCMIAGRRGDWADHPFLICSLDTAKTARNRTELLERRYDLVVVDEAHRPWPGNSWPVSTASTCSFSPPPPCRTTCANSTTW